MSLLFERGLWRKQISQQGRPNVVDYYVTEYEKIKDSEESRMSRTIEQVCEYILYLESKLKGKV